jgi:hypothetical protein
MARNISQIAVLPFARVLIMSNYQLQVFRPFEKGDCSGSYRFVVVDPSKSYPANFVCLLPKKIYDFGKPLSVFGKIFGDKSSEYAIALLRDAVKQETDEKVKIELEKRLETFESKKPKLKCSSCHKEFEEFSRIRYRRTLCKSCLELRILQKQNEIVKSTSYPR